MIFKTNEIYAEDLPVSFGALSKRQLADTLRDGRAAAFLVYEHLLARFSNLRRATDEGRPADCVINDKGIVLQVRMVTSNGTALNPAKQNGIKRKFDKLEYQEARQWVSGYILVDITHAPRIEYAVVPKDSVPESGSGKFSYEDATSLISLARPTLTSPATLNSKS